MDERELMSDAREGHAAEGCFEQYGAVSSRFEQSTLRTQTSRRISSGKTTLFVHMCDV